MTESSSESEPTAADWQTEILQALVSTVSPDQAARACAAAWLLQTPADAVAVVVFLDEATCLVATAVHSQTTPIDLTISVNRVSASVADLLDDAATGRIAARAGVTSASLTLRLPDQLAAVVVGLDHASPEFRDSHAAQLATSLTRQILSQTSQRHCLFAEPRHTEALAEFSAGAGHEVNNPLGSIIGQAQLLLKKVDRADYREALETIGAQAWRIRDMIGDSMLFARPPQPEFVTLNVTDIIRAAADAVRSNESVDETQLRTELPLSPLTANIDPAQIATLVTRLLRNSCEATRQQSAPRQITVAVTAAEPHAFILAVQDNGPGIQDAAVRRHLFDPFFSGRQAGRGLGFGLCLSWQIVRQHAGLLLQQNVPGGGCRFVAALPVSGAAGIGPKPTSPGD